MDLDALLRSHCQPLKGAQHLLPKEQLEQALEFLPQWSQVEEGKAMRRTYDFPDFHRTMAYVNALAFMAHNEDHHPDLGVHYNRVVVRYSTHDCGGLTRNDLICAAKANQLYSQIR